MSFEQSLYGIQKEIQAKIGTNLIRNPFFVADAYAVDHRPAGWVIAPPTGFTVTSTDSYSQIITVLPNATLSLMDVIPLNSGTDNIDLPSEFTSSIYFKPDVPSLTESLTFSYIDSLGNLIKTFSYALNSPEWTLISSQLQFTAHSFKVRISAPRSVAIKLVSLVPGALEPNYFAQHAMTEQDFQSSTVNVFSNLSAETQARIDADIAEALARSNADNAEALARSNADAAEVIARNEAIADEALARSNADAAEVIARNEAIADEALARSNADAAEALARSNADSSLDTRLNTIETQDAISAYYTGRIEGNVSFDFTTLPAIAENFGAYFSFGNGFMTCLKACLLQIMADAAYYVHADGDNGNVSMETYLILKTSGIQRVSDKMLNAYFASNAHGHAPTITHRNLVFGTYTFQIGDLLEFETIANIIAGEGGAVEYRFSNTNLVVLKTL